MKSDILRTFEVECVDLDGRHFIDCNFVGCELVYSGARIPRFEGGQIDNCHWRFEGPARETLKFLRLLKQAGGQALVDDLLALTDRLDPDRGADGEPDSEIGEGKPGRRVGTR